MVIFTHDKYLTLVAHFAAMFTAAIPIPINPKAAPAELRLYLEDSAARFLIIGQEQAAIAASVVSSLGNPPAIGCDFDLVAASSNQARITIPTADSPALMIYTSGTTGQPKAVVHTYANLSAGLSTLAETWHISPADAVLDVLPLFHVHGLCFAAQTTLLAGGCLLLEDRFELEQTANSLQDATVFMAVPTIYYRFLECAEFPKLAQRWQSVRLYTCGSAPVRPEVLPNLAAILGKPIINRYGMSEALVIASVPLQGPYPVGSVGLPLRGVEWRLIRDTSQQSTNTEVGEIAVRGPHLFREYWRRPELTRERIREGWFYTGDYGYLDEQGFLYLVGRRDDLIITSGFNVYPQTVEQAINSYPGVRESVVVGLPDRMRGEIVAAVVVTEEAKITEANLQNYLRDKLSGYQVPRIIRIVPSIPRNALGKILRQQIREYLLEELQSKPGHSP
ncbi:Long-chain-fatty-acid--CoA ligase [bacterium HR36]|nr:Long-chain-fatty-acid--CoA ligase [bacterium HR36]